jgi:hypothetical protein
VSRNQNEQWPKEIKCKRKISKLAVFTNGQRWVEIYSPIREVGNGTKTTVSNKKPLE